MGSRLCRYLTLGYMKLIPGDKVTLSEWIPLYLNSLSAKWEIMVVCVSGAGEWIDIHEVPKCVPCTQEGHTPPRWISASGSSAWLFWAFDTEVLHSVHPCYPGRDPTPVILNQRDFTP